MNLDILALSFLDKVKKLENKKFSFLSNEDFKSSAEILKEVLKDKLIDVKSLNFFLTKVKVIEFLEMNNFIKKFKDENRAIREVVYKVI